VFDGWWHMRIISIAVVFAPGIEGRMKSLCDSQTIEQYSLHPYYLSAYTSVPPSPVHSRNQAMLFSLHVL
jgi:hypothetical protein